MLPIVPFLTSLLVKKGLPFLAAKVGLGGKDMVKVFGDIVGVDIDDRSAMEKALENTKTLAILKDLKTSDIEASLENVKDARKSQIERMKITGKPDLLQSYLAWVFVIGFFGLLFSLMLWGTGLANFPEWVTALITTTVGILVSQVKDVGNYYFGSSKGSADKTKLLKG